MFFLMLVLIFPCAAQPIELSFETLFPASPMKMVLDMCMQVVDDLFSLQEMESPTTAHFQMDAILGKVVRLHNKVHQFSLVCPQEFST